MNHLALHKLSTKHVIIMLNTIQLVPSFPYITPKKWQEFLLTLRAVVLKLFGLRIFLHFKNDRGPRKAFI